jgi:hypothetical protein
MENASESTKILEDFFKGIKEAEIRKFRSSFHLRPVTDSITIVSTLSIAPMRGVSVNTKDLKNRLARLMDVLSEKDDDQKLEILANLKFEHRASESMREENFQAFLIQDMVSNPKHYEGMLFVTSELDLPKYGDSNDKKKRADVIGYKDGVLYDIELKNARLTSTVTQARGYVDYLKENLNEFSKRLSAFPNCKIGEVRDVKGIAVLPGTDKSSGRLESCAAAHSVALWYFSHGFRIDTK